MEMKFGKFCMGIAAAVAVAGLLSLGTQTAKGELELVPNPGGTGSAANPQVSADGSDWNYTYYLGIVDASTNATNFTLSALANGTTAGSTSGGLNYSGPADTGSILNNFFQISDFNGYISDSSNSTNWGTYNNGPTPTGASTQTTQNDWVLLKTGTTLMKIWRVVNIIIPPPQRNPSRLCPVLPVRRPPTFPALFPRRPPPLIPPLSPVGTSRPLWQPLAAMPLKIMILI